MSLCFHIIYTPGTVKPLQLLLHSLLKWSDCTFHLVANGCTRPEMSALQQLCADNPRLIFSALPTKQTMVHGAALNYLQAQNQAQYFCFMDSDIYAVGEFMPTFLPLLVQYSALFSGMPLRYEQRGLLLPQEQSFMAGPYTHTRDGLCLGTTFFAIYHNQALTELRRSTGIGFTKYRWAELPAPYQEALQALGLQSQLYDTAKLLNLALHLHGSALHYQPCPPLRHIEAVSRYLVLQQRAWWRQGRSLARRWYNQWRGQKQNLTYDAALPYLSGLLLALANGRQAPKLPSANGMVIDDWVLQARTELLALQAEFGKA
jgi:hypothetical protein